MTEAELLKRVAEIRKAELATLREASLDHPERLSYHRAHALVLNPVLWEERERAHIRTCRLCTRLIESMERNVSHPSWWTLVLWTLGKLTGEEAKTMRWHMEDGQCQRCLRLTQSGLFRTLTKLVEEGQRTREQVQAVEDAAVTAYASLRLAGEVANHTRPPFQRRAVRPDGLLTLTVRETPRHDFLAHVETPDPSLAGRAVRVEVFGGRESVSADVVLKAQEADGCAGEHTFGRFAELAARLGDNFGLLAVPAEAVPGGDDGFPAEET